MNLELKNCRLRSWYMDDAVSLQRYANNRNIWVNLRDIFPHPYTLADAHAFIEFVAQEKPETTFAIATASEVIGCIGLKIGTDVHRKTAELGYWLGEPFWGKGIMAEAVNVITTYGFDHLDFIRVYAEPFASNAASIRVLERALFFYEGRLRAHVLKNGKLLDAVVYAKVRDSLQGARAIMQSKLQTNKNSQEKE